MKKIFQLIALVIVLVIGAGLLMSVLNGGPIIGGGGGGQASSGNADACKHNDVNESYQVLDQSDSEYLTMHLYSAVCMECGKAIVEPIRFPHTYVGGICKCGIVCEHPSLKDDGLHCSQCNAEINISFDISGIKYVVKAGSTWKEANDKLGIFSIDAAGRVMLNGTCLTDASGYLVKSSYKVASGGVYRYCRHDKMTGESFDPDPNVSTVHLHYYNCATCGAHQSKQESCSYVGGVCQYCTRACAHSWVSGVCSVCGLICEHDYLNGVCNICHDGCEHEWSDGKCTLCDVYCKHPGEYPNSKCEVCGYPMIGFTVNGEYWVVPDGGTWLDALQYTLRFSLDEQERVCYDGTVVLGQNGQPVGMFYTIVPGVNYITCTHEASSSTYHVSDNGAHTRMYVCSICGYQDSELENHHYSSSVCVDCGYTCTHMVENGSCRFCGKALDVFYVNDNYVFYAPTNAYWTWVTMSFEEPYNGDFESVDGKVYWRGYLLTDAYGNAVMTETNIPNEGFYYTCQHKSTYVSSFQYLNTKQHIQYHKCTQCDTTVNFTLVDHSWLDGFCMFCEYQCTHPLGDGIYEHCEVCGYEWRWFTVDGFRFPFVHGMTYGQLDGWLALFDAQDSGNMTFKDKALKYADDTPVKATDMIHIGDVLFAEHHYDSDGICTDCGQECYHCIHDQSGHCTTCGKLVSHGYDNFEGRTCKVCGWVCPHDRFVDKECVYCAHQCYHDIHDQSGRCTTCGKLVSHGYDNFEGRTCKVCGWVCPHDQFADGDCIYCGHEEDE